MTTSLMILISFAEIRGGVSLSWESSKNIARAQNCPEITIFTPIAYRIDIKQLKRKILRGNIAKGKVIQVDHSLDYPA